MLAPSGSDEVSPKWVVLLFFICQPEIFSINERDPLYPDKFMDEKIQNIGRLLQ